MARPDTWMPMYWRDFWADTGHLSPIEGWAYINLIGAYWTNGGLLPNDDARLARQAKVSPAEWRKVRPTVIAFFTVDDKAIKHRRIDAELAEATRLYDKRKAHIDAVNEKRRQKQSQSPSTVTVNNDAPNTATVTATQPQLQPQSPNGESEAKASGRARPKKPPGVALASDWKPDEQTCAVGRELGLTDAEISAELSPGGPFFDWFDDGQKRPGWDKTARAWLRRGAREIIGRRPRTGKPGQHRSGAGSVVDVVTRLKARADLGRSHDGNGMGWGGDGVSAAGEHSPGNTGESGGDGGEVIDAADAERLYRDARRVEVAHSSPDGGDGEPGGPTDALREESGGLPGGRDAESAFDASEPLEMVAVMGGVEGEAGPVLAASAPADRCAEDDLEIPAFLDRRHELTRCHE